MPKIEWKGVEKNFCRKHGICSTTQVSLRHPNTVGDSDDLHVCRKKQSAVREDVVLIESKMSIGIKPLRVIAKFEKMSSSVVTAKDWNTAQ